MLVHRSSEEYTNWLLGGYFTGRPYRAQCPPAQRVLRNKPIPLELICYPPDLSINIPNLFNVSPGPPPMLRMRRDYPRFTFRGPWSGGLASMHPTPVPSGDDGVLAGGAFTGFCKGPSLAGPT